MKKIGILGGTFNPVHIGHIELAKKAMKEFRLDEVLFVPTGTPPHKTTKGLASRKHRLKMATLAVDDHKNFKVSKIELNRGGFSYAVDTFNKLKRRYGAKADLYYIMGLDSINTIWSWKKPLELFKLCKFIIATRPGSKIRTFRRLIKFPPLGMNKDRISLIELKIKISSSDLRDKIKKGKDTSKYLPQAVAAYIDSESLYKQ